ncbi:hypothetical protein [Nostoc sp. DedQUE09]|uniref:hypothetical protein n=1 Tax=Nostoc sp. DedQUE09 TaxID=3075394 RepID=UPI002AD50FB8|nr:hypothetical protein [Nostoc sp. DedQUE09]MDZ7954655.1 hypothetical protein [Nostoc sp. DedQUE09]
MLQSFATHQSTKSQFYVSLGVAEVSDYFTLQEEQEILELVGKQVVTGVEL